MVQDALGLPPASSGVIPSLPLSPHPPVAVLLCCASPLTHLLCIMSPADVDASQKSYGQDNCMLPCSLHRTVAATTIAAAASTIDAAANTTASAAAAVSSISVPETGDKVKMDVTCVLSCHLTHIRLYQLSPQALHVKCTSTSDGQHTSSRSRPLYISQS